MTKILRRILIFWTLFIGLGAVGGAVCMFIDPTGATTGMSGLLPGLQKLPFADAVFQNLIFSGVSLFMVNGLTQLITFALIMKKHPAAYKCGLGCGVILIMWICIQFFIFPANALSISYFIFGLLEAATGVMLVKRA